MRSKLSNAGLYIRVMLVIAVCAACVLGGCGNEFVPIEDDFSVNDKTTSAGISVGATFSEFAEVYSEFPIQRIDNSDGGNWVAYSIPNLKKTPDAGNDDMTLMVSYFFVDGVAVSTKTLLEETGTESENLVEYLSSPEYLNDHSVVFRYMIFDFSAGTITDIRADYLDYNNELY